MCNIFNLTNLLLWNFEYGRFFFFKFTVEVYSLTMKVTELKKYYLKLKSLAFIEQLYNTVHFKKYLDSVRVYFNE